MRNTVLILVGLAVAAFAGWQLLGGDGDAVVVPSGLTLEEEVRPAAPDEGRELASAEAAAPAPAAARSTGAEEGTVEVFRDLARVDELMERDAAVALSDAEGRLHLASTAKDTAMLLLGRAPGLWGKLGIWHGRQERPELGPLVLRPDRTVLAQVVDEAGKPLGGHDVTIEEAHEHWSDEQARVTSAGDGIATFLHVQHAFADARGDEGGRRVVQLGVLAPSPIREPLTEDADVAPIVLVAPATGSVEVRLLTFEEEPFPVEVYTNLTQVPEGSPRVPSPFSNERRSELGNNAVDGVARYEFVALGMQLDAHASRPGAFLATHAYAPGPARAGEMVRIDLRFGANQPIVQLRLLDEDAAPIVSRAVSVELRTHGGYLPGNQEGYPSTDADGFVRIDLAPVSSEEVRRSATITLRGEGESQPSADLELPEVLRNGLNDLGEVTLGEAPLFVAGRVRSIGGEALEGAMLAVEHRAEDDRAWRNKMRFNARSRADGTFEAHGHEPPGAYRIAARVSGFAAKWVEFVPGARDVVLDLTPEATIEGRILVDEGLDPQGLRVRISGGPRGERLDYRQRMAVIEDDGSFAFRGLHPVGDRTVHLQFDDVWKDLQTFGGVTAVTVGGGQDPRLNPIDLRGLLFAHQILVTGIGEDAALSGQVSYGPAGSGELEFERWLYERSVVVLSSTPRIDLLGNFEGFRQVELLDIGESATIELRPALRVTLVLAGEVPLPEPPLYLKPALAPAEDEDFDPDVGGDALDEGRSVLVDAPAAGRLRVMWIAERRSNASSIAGQVQLERTQYIDVVDGLEGQSFEVTLTAEEMKTIAERFR